MIDMEKKVMVRLCAKIVAETDLYETDKEMQNLIDWVCLSEQIKTNNNTIRNLTGEYKKTEKLLERKEMWGVAVAMPYIL